VKFTLNLFDMFSDGGGGENTESRRQQVMSSIDLAITRKQSRGHRDWLLPAAADSWAAVYILYMKLD
jgi:hypothetical protein